MKERTKDILIVYNHCVERFIKKSKPYGARTGSDAIVYIIEQKKYYDALISSFRDSVLTRKASNLLNKWQREANARYIELIKEVYDNE